MLSYLLAMDDIFAAVTS